MSRIARVFGAVWKFVTPVMFAVVRVTPALTVVVFQMVTPPVMNVAFAIRIRTMTAPLTVRGFGAARPSWTPAEFVMRILIMIVSRQFVIVTSILRNAIGVRRRDPVFVTLSVTRWWFLFFVIMT